MRALKVCHKFRCKRFFVIDGHLERLRLPRRCDFNDATIWHGDAAMAQMSFLDLSEFYASLDAKRVSLMEMDAVVPWQEFHLVLERVWHKLEAKRKW